MFILLFLKTLWNRLRDKREQAINWIFKHHIAILLIVLFIFLLIFLYSRITEPKEVQIVMPSQEIKELEKENEERIKSILDDIDQKREADDAKIAEAAKSPTPRKKNITAEELERLVNGKK